MSYNGWEFRGAVFPGHLYLIQYWYEDGIVQSTWRPASTRINADRRAAGLRGKGYLTRIWRVDTSGMAVV